MKFFVAQQKNTGGVGTAQLARCLNNDVKHRLQRIGGAADNLQHFGRRCLELQRFLEVAGALLQVPIGLGIVYRYHCLLGEGSGPKHLDDQVAELMGAVGRLVNR